MYFASLNTSFLLQIFASKGFSSPRLCLLIKVCKVIGLYLVNGLNCLVIMIDLPDLHHGLEFVSISKESHLFWKSMISLLNRTYFIIGLIVLELIWFWYWLGCKTFFIEHAQIVLSASLRCAVFNVSFYSDTICSHGSGHLITCHR